MMHTPYNLNLLIIYIRARHNPDAINKNQLTFTFFVDVRITLPYIQIIETNKVELIMINLNEYNGRFLPNYGETAFNTLDGLDVAAWLQSQGYIVVSNGDTGHNGYAETACGWRVSTNGYVCRV